MIYFGDADRIKITMEAIKHTPIANVTLFIAFLSFELKSLFSQYAILISGNAINRKVNPNTKDKIRVASCAAAITLTK